MKWEEASWTCRGNPCSWVAPVEDEAVAYFVEGIKVRYWHLCRLSHFTREGRKGGGYCHTFWQKAVDVNGCWCGSPPRYVFVVAERGFVLSGDSARGS